MELGAEHCPRCREEIQDEYAIASAMVVHHNTQAISVAKTISSSDAFIPLALIGSVFVLVGDWYTYGAPRNFLLIFFWPAVPLLAIIVWYFRFGRFKIGDDEYLEARRDMRKSFCFWLAFLVVQVLCAMAW